MGHAEPDDVMHNPDPRRDKKIDLGGTICTSRGFGNLGCLAFLVLAMLTLLYVDVLPLIHFSHVLT